LYIYSVHHSEDQSISRIYVCQCWFWPIVPEPSDGAVYTPRVFSFWFEAAPEARRALVAAALGWMLDAFDVMLYALVLSALVQDATLGLDLTTGGQLGSITLAASALGGVGFGVIADRYGRTRALSLSILLYSLFTFACGFAQNVAQLAVFRFFLGLGFGGEWASGAALVSETWPERHRGKALGLMQSSWAIGYGLAALVNWAVLPRFGWRAVFFVGVAPALLTFAIRRYVPEPVMWSRTRTATASQPRARLSGYLGITLIVASMNAATMFAWWGLNLWAPSYLSLPIDRGGIGLSPQTMSWFVVVMQVGSWLGYVTFGFVSDALGRRPTYVGYLLLAAGLVLAYGWTTTPTALLLLGPFVAFFGTGYFSGFGAIASELYPTSIRATAMGLTYNVGRLLSAVAPLVVGTLAQTQGFGAAFTVTAGGFLVAAAFWLGIPETKGRQLA
jgi:MFS family permease